MPKYYNQPIRVTTDGVLVNNVLATVSEQVARYLKGCGMDRFTASVVHITDGVVTFLRPNQRTLKDALGVVVNGESSGDKARRLMTLIRELWAEIGEQEYELIALAESQGYSLTPVYQEQDKVEFLFDTLDPTSEDLHAEAQAHAERAHTEAVLDTVDAAEGVVAFVDTLDDSPPWNAD